MFMMDQAYAIRHFSTPVTQPHQAILSDADKGRAQVRQDLYELRLREAHLNPNGHAGTVTRDTSLPPATDVETAQARYTTI